MHVHCLCENDSTCALAVTSRGNSACFPFRCQAGHCNLYIYIYMPHCLSGRWSHLALQWSPTLIILWWPSHLCTLWEPVVCSFSSMRISISMSSLLAGHSRQCLPKWKKTTKKKKSDWRTNTSFFQVSLFANVLTAGGSHRCAGIGLDTFQLPCVLDVSPLAYLWHWPFCVTYQNNVEWGGMKGKSHGQCCWFYLTDLCLSQAGITGIIGDCVCAVHSRFQGHVHSSYVDSI